MRTNTRPFNYDNMALVTPHIVTESISNFERNCAVCHHDNFELKIM
jgi:formate-dependent nitrite reductase cytochrome c552 subunit